MTWQLRKLEPSDLRITFTTNTVKEALKQMLSTYQKLREDLVLYNLDKDKDLKVSDTQIYRRYYEETGSLPTCNF